MNRSIASLFVAAALASSPIWAAKADKACLKQAKADYTTAVKACKDKTGADKKACKKDAKASYTTAKEACKAPAAAPAATAPAETAPAPAGSAQ